MPRKNVAYWAPKLRANVARDRLAVKTLGQLGWKTLVVWECELTRQKARQVARAMKFLNSR